MSKPWDFWSLLREAELYNEQKIKSEKWGNYRCLAPLHGSREAKA
jgi:hypothetical protein